MNAMQFELIEEMKSAGLNPVVNTEVIKVRHQEYIYDGVGMNPHSPYYGEPQIRMRRGEETFTEKEIVSVKYTDKKERECEVNLSMREGLDELVSKIIERNR